MATSADVFSPPSFALISMRTRRGRLASGTSTLVNRDCRRASRSAGSFHRRHDSAAQVTAGVPPSSAHPRAPAGGPCGGIRGRDSASHSRQPQALPFANMRPRNTCGVLIVNPRPGWARQLPRFAINDVRTGIFDGNLRSTGQAAPRTRRAGCVSPALSDGNTNRHRSAPAISATVGVSVGHRAGGVASHTKLIFVLPFDPGDMPITFGSDCGGREYPVCPTRRRPPSADPASAARWPAPLPGGERKGSPCARAPERSAASR